MATPGQRYRCHEVDHDQQRSQPDRRAAPRVDATQRRGEGPCGRGREPLTGGTGKSQNDRKAEPASRPDRKSRRFALGFRQVTGRSVLETICENMGQKAIVSDISK